MKSNIQKIVMRRVYYHFVVSIFTHTMFFRGVFLGVSAVLLAKWLHVASIVHNFLSVPVGHAPKYIANSFWNAATHGELLTVLTLVVAGGMAVSVGYKFAQAFMPKLWIVRQF